VPVRAGPSHLVDAADWAAAGRLWHPAAVTLPTPRRPGQRRHRRTTAPVSRRLAVAVALLLAVAVAGCTDSPRAGVGGVTTSSDATASTTGSTQAAPTGAVRSGFVAFGDFGGGPAQQAVARAMERWAADHRVDVLVTTGDNVYQRGEPEKFGTQIDEPYRELRRGRALWVTLGNHDVRSGNGTAQLRHLGLPDLPYAKTLPGVQLLFLDANRPDQAQADWLEEQLAAPGPRFRVPVFHQPAWSCSAHDSTEEVINNWVPVFERHRVALVLNGHDHNYQRFVSDQGVTYVVTGGGGRDLYKLDSCPNSTPRRVSAVRRHHFTGVEVRTGSLAVTAVGEDGSVLDRAVIRR
jgi:calcineurin-like phosphoesterase family protein